MNDDKAFVRAYWVGFLVIGVVLLGLAAFFASDANAQSFWNWGGAGDDSEMVCTIGGEVVDCPGGPPTAAETFWNKLIHAAGVVVFAILVLLARAPWIQKFTVPHRDLDEIIENEMKLKFKTKAAKRPALTEAESRAVAAMTWKNTISYAVIVLGGVWVMMGL